MKLLYLLMFLVVNAHARPTPPSPSAVPGVSPAPGPPSLPINENLIVILIVALIYGLYVVYNNREFAKS